MPCEIDEVARGGEYTLGALSHFDPGRSERNFARPAFDQFGPDLAFEIPDLHGEGRLRHRAIVGGTAEMPVARERREVAQLSQ